MKLIDAKHTTDPYTFQPELELVISVPLEPIRDIKSANAATYEMLGRLFSTNVLEAAARKLNESNLREEK